MDLESVTLQQLLEDVCPHCGSGSEDVVEYFKKHKTSAYQEAKKLKSFRLSTCLEILLSSDIDIFTEDYYDLLMYAKDNEDFYYSTRDAAKNIYELYKNKFDEIGYKITERRNKMAIKFILFAVLIVLLIVGIVWLVHSICNESYVQLGIAAFVSVVLLAVLVLVPGSIHQVKTGEIAVVREYGVIKESKAPGIYYQGWIKHKYEYYDTKVQQITVTTPAYSSDGQTLDIEVFIQYKVKQDKIIDIATQYGDLKNLESRIQTVSIERLKSVISEKSAMGIIATRNNVSADVTQRIEQAIGEDYYVDITNVVLTNIDFTDEFEKIVEDKVAAEQEAQKAVNEAAKKQTEAEAAKKVAELQADAELYKAQKEAEALLLKAQAEADALKLEKAATAEAIKEYVNSLNITAEEAVKLYEYLIWVQKWDGDVPTVTDGSTGYVVVPQP